MRLKIVGDGTVGVTKVINEETGDAVEDVAQLTYALGSWPHETHDAQRQATLTLTLLNVPIEIAPTDTFVGAGGITRIAPRR